MKKCIDCQFCVAAETQTPAGPVAGFMCLCFEGQPEPVTGLEIEVLPCKDARLCEALCGWTARRFKKASQIVMPDKQLVMPGDVKTE